jgi:hypothetical protein
MDERKMPENLTHIETLARAHTGVAIKTLASIMVDPSAPARVRRKAAAILRGFLRRFPAGDVVPGDRRAARAFRAKSKG